MSGISGYVNFDGESANTDVLANMANLAKYRSVDGLNHFSEDNVGFSFLALDALPESKIEKQPLISQDRAFILVADARIDNREELRKKLGIGGNENKLTDARYILLSYQKWKESCPAHLVGDFSFVIWDKNEKRLFAARDRLGNKPFYYRKTSTGFYWGSEAVQLFYDSTIKVEIDNTMVARDLASPGHGGRHRTYFKGVNKLGPAESITVTADGSSIKRYWEFQPGSNLVYKKDEEYVEHFFELFSTVVKGRMRSSNSTGLFLSGGLDSASIAAVSATRENQKKNAGLFAINFTNSRTLIANEYDQSRKVASHLDIDYKEFDVANFPLLTEFSQYKPHFDEPYCSHLESYYVSSLASLNVDKRPKIWMTGHPGDMVIGGHNPYYFNKILLQQGLGNLIDKIKEQSEIYNISFKRVFLEFFVKPVYVYPLKQRMKKVFLNKKTSPYPWINKNLIKEANLDEWLRESVAPRFDHTDPEKIWTNSMQFKRMRDITWNQESRMEVWFDRMAAQFGAEIWNPWNDYRLGEFVLNIPEELINEGLNNKLILRDSIRHLLPESITEIRKMRTGPGRGIMDDVNNNEFTKARLHSLINTCPTEFEFINKKALNDSLEDVQQGRVGFTFAMWMAFSLERWLQKYF